jgi:hypothetical protein
VELGLPGDSNSAEDAKNWALEVYKGHKEDVPPPIKERNFWSWTWMRWRLRFLKSIWPLGSFTQEKATTQSICLLI